MTGRWILAVALLAPVVLAAQDTGTLRVKVTLLDARSQPTPIARHALLISDNPATAPPRPVRTAADGTAVVKLPPGAYMVESERAVRFGSRAYEWFQPVEIRAGQDVVLELGPTNAEVADPDARIDAAAGLPEDDPVVRAGQWQRSVVAVWSPIARATGVVVDAGGLIATHRYAFDASNNVAVQVSDIRQVPGRVLALDASRDVAIVWISPSVIAGRPPVPVECPPAVVPSVTEEEEIATLAVEWSRSAGVMRGRVTALGPRVVETDLGLPSGGAGGPVFNEAGQLLGLTTTRDAGALRPTGDVVRAVDVCRALSAARSEMTVGTPPDPVPLPVEPARPYPARAIAEVEASAAGPVPPDVATTRSFDIAFITPLTVARSRPKADWTGGRPTRPPEVEARLGSVTDFGVWSAYFEDAPAVVVVRATPRMVEGFWTRVAREAARTQGADLPPFKRFTTSFVDMTLTCGATVVAPIHPFVMEHRLSEREVVREGLYVFEPNAFDPACAQLTVALSPGPASGAPETVVVPPGTVSRIHDDFAAWREAPAPAASGVPLQMRTHLPAQPHGIERLRDHANRAGRARLFVGPGM